MPDETLLLEDLRRLGVLAHEREGLVYTDIPEAPGPWPVELVAEVLGGICALDTPRLQREQLAAEFRRRAGQR